MINKLIIALAFCLGISITPIQAKNDSVILKGKVLDNIAEGAQLVINVYTDYTKFGEKTLSQNIVTDINANGSFEVHIKSPANLFYIDLILLDKGRAKPMMAKGLGRELYLLANGDSCELALNFDKDKKSIKASGKGSAKINCQNQLYRISFRPRGAVDRSKALASQHQYLLATEVEEMIRYDVVDLQLKILKSYERELDKEVYDRIYMNTIGLAKQSTVTALLAVYISNNDGVLGGKRYFKTIYGQMDTLLNQMPAIDQSAYYADYIFEMERTKLMFGENIDSS